jgi:hypothetical protein
MKEDPYFPAKRRADEGAKLLRDVLADMGVVVGQRDQWPDIKGRATFNGAAHVYLGTVPLPTIEKLTDVLIRTQLAQRQGVPANARRQAAPIPAGGKDSRSGRPHPWTGRRSERVAHDGAGTDSPFFEGRKRTMTERPDFEFVGMSMCRPRSGIKNCPEVATNVPGVVALRDSADPDSVVTMTTESWALFTDAVKAGEYDTA